MFCPEIKAMRPAAFLALLILVSLAFSTTGRLPMQIDQPPLIPGMGVPPMHVPPPCEECPAEGSLQPFMFSSLNEEAEITTVTMGVQAADERYPVEGATIFAYVYDRDGFETDKCRMYTDSSGTAEFDFSGIPECTGGDGCTMRFIFCCPNPGQGCLIASCLDEPITDYTDFPMCADYSGGIWPEAATVDGSEEPLFPAYTETVRPPEEVVIGTAFEFDLCFPVLVIFGFLAAAMFAAGRNPFSAFSIYTPRYTRGAERAISARGFSIDAASVASALGLAMAGGKALKKAAKKAAAKAKKAGVSAKKVQMAVKGAQTPSKKLGVQEGEEAKGGAQAQKAELTGAGGPTQAEIAMGAAAGKAMPGGTAMAFGKSFFKAIFSIFKGGDAARAAWAEFGQLMSAGKFRGDMAAQYQGAGVREAGLAFLDTLLLFATPFGLYYAFGQLGPVKKQLAKYQGQRNALVAAGLINQFKEGTAYIKEKDGIVTVQFDNVATGETVKETFDITTEKGMKAYQHFLNINIVMPIQIGTSFIQSQMQEGQQEMAKQGNGALTGDSGDLLTQFYLVEQGMNVAELQKYSDAKAVDAVLTDRKATSEQKLFAFLAYMSSDKANLAKASKEYTSFNSFLLGYGGAADLVGEDGKFNVSALTGAMLLSGQLEGVSEKKVSGIAAFKANLEGTVDRTTGAAQNEAIESQLLAMEAQMLLEGKGEREIAVAKNRQEAYLRGKGMGISSVLATEGMGEDSKAVQLGILSLGFANMAYSEQLGNKSIAETGTGKLNKYSAEYAAWKKLEIDVSERKGEKLEQFADSYKDYQAFLGYSQEIALALPEMPPALQYKPEGSPSAMAIGVVSGQAKLESVPKVSVGDVAVAGTYQIVGNQQEAATYLKNLGQIGNAFETMGMLLQPMAVANNINAMSVGGDPETGKEGKPVYELLVSGEPKGKKKGELYDSAIYVMMSTLETSFGEPLSTRGAEEYKQFDYINSGAKKAGEKPPEYKGAELQKQLDAQAAIILDPAADPDAKAKALEQFGYLALGTIQSSGSAKKDRGIALDAIAELGVTKATNQYTDATLGPEYLPTFETTTAETAAAEQIQITKVQYQAPQPEYSKPETSGMLTTYLTMGNTFAGTESIPGGRDLKKEIDSQTKVATDPNSSPDQVAESLLVLGPLTLGVLQNPESSAQDKALARAALTGLADKVPADNLLPPEETVAETTAGEQFKITKKGYGAPPPAYAPPEPGAKPPLAGVEGLDPMQNFQNIYNLPSAQKAIGKYMEDPKIHDEAFKMEKTAKETYESIPVGGYISKEEKETVPFLEERPLPRATERFEAPHEATGPKTREEKAAGHSKGGKK